jgi:hypothetical protein
MTLAFITSFHDHLVTKTFFIISLCLPRGCSLLVSTQLLCFTSGNKGFLVEVINPTSIFRQIRIWGLEAIWRDDQVVGYLRRGEYGYALGASIGQG